MSVKFSSSLPTDREVVLGILNNSVEALNKLGAEVIYEEEEGFPPVRIKGKKLVKNILLKKLTLMKIKNCLQSSELEVFRQLF